LSFFSLVCNGYPCFPHVRGKFFQGVLQVLFHDVDVAQRRRDAPISHIFLHNRQRHFLGDKPARRRVPQAWIENPGFYPALFSASLKRLCIVWFAGRSLSEPLSDAVSQVFGQGGDR
jgi:hypothetical protein